MRTENALRAIADGAYDFIAKPVDLDDLRVILKRAFHIVAGGRRDGLA